MREREELAAGKGQARGATACLPLASGGAPGPPAESADGCCSLSSARGRPGQR
jgi:hypothetical protein